MKNNRAFTLVEIIVALGIFSIVAVVALGALVKIISANKKAQTLQTSITNLNYALEAMSREMRTGSNFYCSGSAPFTIPGPQDCPDEDSLYLSFYSSRSDLDNNKLINSYYFENIDGRIVISKGLQTDVGTSPDNFSELIDENVTITSAHIQVATIGTDTYPLATILLSGYAGVREREKTYFDLQTSISARLK